MGEALYAHDYSIISFYRESNEDEKNIDSLMDKVATYIDDQITADSPRDLAYYRVNLDATPELAPDERGTGDQMIYSRTAAMRRMLGVKSDDTAENVGKFLMEMSGDWVTEIACSDIQKEGRRFFDELVYMGPKEDLIAGGELAFFSEIAEYDSYVYHHQKVGFHYNSDPECWAAHGVDKDTRAFMSFNGSDSKPGKFTFEEVKEDLPMHVAYMMQTSILKGTPNWGERAFSAFKDF